MFKLPITTVQDGHTTRFSATDITATSYACLTKTALYGYLFFTNAIMQITYNALSIGTMHKITKSTHHQRTWPLTDSIHRQSFPPTVNQHHFQPTFKLDFLFHNYTKCNSVLQRRIIETTGAGSKRSDDVLVTNLETDTMINFLRSSNSYWHPTTHNIQEVNNLQATKHTDFNH